MFNFKNRAVQIQLVKTDKQQIDTPVTEIDTVDPETIAKMATEFAVKTIVTVGAVFAATVVLKTVCTIVEEVTISKMK